MIEGSLGGGRYWLDERFDGERRQAGGWGGRAGVSLTLYWRAIGYTIGYAYHLTEVSLDDGLGGTIGAGGHEFGGGLSVRF